MKFKRFDQAQGALQIKTLSSTGQAIPGEMPFHKVNNPDGFCVVCVELSTAELRSIKDNGGEFYIIYGPGVEMPPIMQILPQSPFGFSNSKIRINGKAKDQDADSARDDS